MESGGGASGGGRYEEKGGGQQVGSLFAEATDNEKIKAIYGNYCFWSWLRYWHLDSADYITLLLMDKGYYDYDYEAVKEIPKQKTYEETVKSDEEIRDILGRFGWGKQKLSPEELQAEVMKERNNSNER